MFCCFCFNGTPPSRCLPLQDDVEVVGTGVLGGGGGEEDGAVAGHCQVVDVAQGFAVHWFGSIHQLCVSAWKGRVRVKDLNSFLTCGGGGVGVYVCVRVCVRVRACVCVCVLLLLLLLLLCCCCCCGGGGGFHTQREKRGEN